MTGNNVLYFCDAHLTRVEVEEDDIASSGGQTSRLEFGQVLKSDHDAAAIVREETVSSQRCLTHNLHDRVSDAEVLRSTTKSQINKAATVEFPGFPQAHLSSPGIELCDGALRQNQQRARVTSYAQVARGARSLQPRAPQALQQLQVPHFTLTDKKRTELQPGAKRCKIKICGFSAEGYNQQALLSYSIMCNVNATVQYYRDLCVISLWDFCNTSFRRCLIFNTVHFISLCIYLPRLDTECKSIADFHLI